MLPYDKHIRLINLIITHRLFSTLHLFIYSRISLTHFNFFMALPSVLSIITYTLKSLTSLHLQFLTPSLAHHFSYLKPSNPLLPFSWILSLWTYEYLYPASCHSLYLWDYTYECVCQSVSYSSDSVLRKLLSNCHQLVRVLHFERPRLPLFLRAQCCRLLRSCRV